VKMEAGGDRLKLLKQWLDELGIKPSAITSASSDASFRRYLRIHLDNTTLIAMDAPPDREPVEPFIRIAGLFSEAGLNIPRIHHAAPERGLLLLDDFGDRQLLNLLEPASVDRHYGDALQALATLQSAAIGADQLPRYSTELLRGELELFRDWLLKHHLAIEPGEGMGSLLDESFNTLINNALTQPQVAVHRDYHSRNLMVLDRNSPGILDFQDAVHGPVTYDLASLLRDCYIAWPADQVDGWVEQHRQRLAEQGLPAIEDSEQFLVWFDLMGIQRHLKAAGIFARLWHRDGKAGYLADIPRTLNYIVETSRRRPQLAELGRLIGDEIIAYLPPLPH
jgi:aminoglycoside/choline kinase family phosphotransferase